ncbi:MAG TPA: TonB-dependent receptor plug domain-containing protein, partial [Paraburkholderia sp.]|nr:TonB-dependent receptor plug domain-containing protein [Paraburkholderia sp.]
MRTPSAIRPLQFATLLVFAGSHAAFAQQSTDATAPAVAESSPSTAENVLPAVTVKSQADSPQHLQKEVSNGALGPRSQLDTPFSTTVVTGQELADRQANKIGDVFFHDASVSDNSNPYNAWASYVTVRGMQLDWQNGLRIDGQPFNSYGITMPYEQLASVDLLKGLSGFMYGFGAPGGIVNYVTKKPPVSDTPIRSIDVGYRSTSIWTTHADLGDRVGPDGMFGYRLNATHEEGKTFNDGNVRRDTVSLSTDARLTRDLTATFGALYQERRTAGITTAISTALYDGTSLPARISGGSSNLVTPDQHLNTNLQFYTAGLHYNLNDDWTLSATYSYSRSTRDRNESTFYLQNSAGDYTDTRYAGVEGNQLSNWQVMAEGHVKTGPFQHQLVFGGAYQRQYNDNTANFFYDQIGVGNIYQPNTNRYEGGGFNTYRNSEVTQ